MTPSSIEVEVDTLASALTAEDTALVIAYAERSLSRQLNALGHDCVLPNLELTLPPGIGPDQAGELLAKAIVQALGPSHA